MFEYFFSFLSLTYMEYVKACKCVIRKYQQFLTFCICHGKRKTMERPIKKRYETRLIIYRQYRGHVGGLLRPSTPFFPAFLVVTLNTVLTWTIDPKCVNNSGTCQELLHFRTFEKLYIMDTGT